MVYPFVIMKKKRICYNYNQATTGKQLGDNFKNSGKVMNPNYVLKRERELRGWSQARLAELLGTEAVTIGRWERGVSFPYPHFREKLSVIFGKSMQELGLIFPETKEQSVVLPSVADVRPVYDPAMPLPLPQPLVGREKLLSVVEQQLSASAGGSFITLYGLPGVGKTSLAIDIAQRASYTESFSDGVLWAGLGPHANPLAHLSRWGSLSGVQPDERSPLKRPEEWVRALRTAIGKRRFLIVLDDVWESSDVLSLQIGGPACVYLITTRFPQLALLFGNDGAVAVPELSEDVGCRLLSWYVPEMEASEPDLTHELVRAVGGLPLALMLMGKHLQMQGYGGLQRRRKATAFRLRDAETRLHLHLPQSAPEAFPSLGMEAHVSLQSVIAVSIELLPEAIQRVFYALSAFPARPGSFSEEAAIAVSGGSPEDLDQLCDTGLLECWEPQRYSLHQTIADYARIYRRENTMVGRMVTYYRNYIQQHAGNEEVLEREMSNILHALSISQDQTMLLEQMQAILLLVPYLSRRGLSGLISPYLLQAYTAAKEQGNDQMLVDILLHLGEGAIWQGEQIQAEHYLQEGLAVARANNGEDKISALLSLLGFTMMQRGKYLEAQQYLHEGLSLARQARHHERCANILRHLGLVALEQSSFEVAETYFQQGLICAREARSVEHQLKILMNLGMVASFQCEFHQAEEWYRQVQPLAHQMKSLDWITALQNNRGQLARRSGDYEQAHRYFDEAISYAQRSGNGFLHSLALLYLTDLEIEQQQYLQAEAHCREGLKIARDLELTEVIVQLLTSLGKASVAQGNNTQAQQAYQEAIELAQKLDASPLLITALYNLGTLFLDEQRLDEAAVIYDQLLAFPGGQNASSFGRMLQEKREGITARQKSMKDNRFL